MILTIGASVCVIFLGMLIRSSDSQNAGFLLGHYISDTCEESSLYAYVSIGEHGDGSCGKVDATTWGKQTCNTSTIQKFEYGSLDDCTNDESRTGYDVGVPNYCYDGAKYECAADVSTAVATMTEHGADGSCGASTWEGEFYLYHCVATYLGWWATEANEDGITFYFHGTDDTCAPDTREDDKTIRGSVGECSAAIGDALRSGGDKHAYVKSVLYDSSFASVNVVVSFVLVMGMILI